MIFLLRSVLEVIKAFSDKTISFINLKHINKTNKSKIELLPIINNKK